MKVFRSSRLLLKAASSPRGELVGYVSSSLLADTFPPFHGAISGLLFRSQVRQETGWVVRDVEGVQ